MLEEPKEIVRPIIIIRDALKKLDLDYENLKLPRNAFARFVDIIEENVEDTRVKNMVTYSLSYVILLAFLGVLSDADSWVGIAENVKLRKKLLKRIFPKRILPKKNLSKTGGVPSHDTIQRVFRNIVPEQLCEAVTAFLIQNLDTIKEALSIKEEGYRLINADGKEAKGTGRKYKTDEKISNQQTLNIYDASNGIVLGSVPIDEKTNEIPTLQDFLKQRSLRDCIVTFDAMNVQTETIRIITEQEGDYVGGLKKNQKLFYEGVEDYFDEKTRDQIRNDKINFRTYVETAHNRIEKRTCYLSTDIEWFANLDKWENLRSFICYEIETEDLVTGKKTFERLFYISSLTDVDVCADAIRGHWSVENQLHWHLDVTFKEDKNTTTDKYAFNNLSILNKTALTIHKLIQPILGVGIELVRKSFGWYLEGLLALLMCLFDASSLKEVLENNNLSFAR